MAFENWWRSKYPLHVSEAYFNLLREAWQAACAEKQKDMDTLTKEWVKRMTQIQELSAQVEVLKKFITQHSFYDEKYDEVMAITPSEALQQRINEEAAKELDRLAENALSAGDDIDEFYSAKDLRKEAKKWRKKK